MNVVVGREKGSILETAAIQTPFPRSWHPTKNGSLREEDFAYYSHKKAWWACAEGHETFVRIQDAHRNHGCGYCANKRVCLDNCLATIYPHIAREWHPTKNRFTPEEVVSESAAHAWWKCHKGDIWRARIQDRTLRKRGCPYCKRRLASQTNNLAAHNPKLAKEWHPWKNNLLTPKDVTPFSGRYFWWRCAKGHDFRAKVLNRQYGWSKCRRCKKKRNVSGTVQG